MNFAYIEMKFSSKFLENKAKQKTKQTFNL